MSDSRSLQPLGPDAAGAGRCGQSRQMRASRGGCGGKTGTSACKVLLSISSLARYPVFVNAPRVNPSRRAAAQAQT